MNRFTYTVLLYLISPFIWGYLLVRGVRAVEYRDGLWQRLGFIAKGKNSAGIVIHCASVGESKAAIPLIQALLAHYDHLPIVVTTTSPTGKQAVLDAFAGRVTHYYLPIDWPGSCQRFLKKLKPQLLILMETEIWPNLLACCSKQSVPVLLANARLSEKSLNQYLKYPRLSLPLFQQVTHICAQYPSDQKHFFQLGVKSENISVTGSIKFDLNLDEILIQQQKELKISWVKGRPVWVAASIHPDEFENILTSQVQLLQQFPDLLLIAVPRHPEQFARFKLACSKHQLNFISRSDNKIPKATTQVVVGDSMGEMLLFCGLADVAFIGGSLIERGGHNPLEPIVCGCPVVMGNSFYNFKEVSQILLDEKLMLTLDRAADLPNVLTLLLKEPHKLQQMSHQCFSVMEKQRGSVDRLLIQISLLVEEV